MLTNTQLWCKSHNVKGVERPLCSEENNLALEEIISSKVYRKKICVVSKYLLLSSILCHREERLIANLILDVLLSRYDERLACKLKHFY